MVYKNKLPWLLIFLASQAQAECYVRSATTQTLLSKIERVADAEQTVVPVNKTQSRCRVTFRALIDGRWHTAQGEELFNNNESIDQACKRAQTATRINILESVSGSRINASQEMICTDKPMPQDRPKVNVGDMVWESEVQPHPLNKEAFAFRGSLCRWFVESSPRVGAVDMEQGIICRARDQKVWRVVDKF